MKLSSLAGWTATLLALTLPRGYSDPGDLPDAVLQQIVDTYVGNAYRRGEATAFSVGITLNGNTFFKSYGFKSFGDTAPTNQINEHSIFELGSVTKVWTTALVGQAVATGTLITDDETGTGPPTTVPVAISIYTTLGDFPAALPLLLAPMKEVTIGELASFTAGFPDVGSTNGNGNRPPISRWGVSDFVAAVSQLVPTNYNEFPPLPVPLPAPYFYSDWSTGLLNREAVIRRLPRCSLAHPHDQESPRQVLQSFPTEPSLGITNPGSGYVGPPVVTIAPGGNHVNVVPVWAAAGSLKSSASDLIRLCQLYLGQQEIDGNSVPINLSLGARFALQALIQNTSSDPTNFVGMAWQTSTNAIEGGFNLSVVKDGALPGFASYVELTPAIDLGVVILRSNNQTGTAEYEDP
jgi:CubicO group peptidase (beta-lactamase class C family)